MFKRLLLALVCLIIFGFIYRLSFLKKHYKIEHFTTTTPTFNDILSNTFCLAEHTGYLNGMCVTTSCPKEKCWEPKQMSTGVEYELNDKVKILDGTGVGTVCETNDSDLCSGVDMPTPDEPTCPTDCYILRQNNEKEYVNESSPNNGSFETLDAARRRDCPVCGSMVEDCGDPEQDKCYEKKNVESRDPWVEHAVYRKRIDDTKTCKDVVRNNGQFILKADSCMTLAEKDKVNTDIDCQSERCWSAVGESISGLEGDYFRISVDDKNKVKENNTGYCASTCTGPRDYKSAPLSCGGFTCSSLEYNSVTKENVVHPITVSNDLYLIQGTGDPSCPTRESVGCESRDLLACPPVINETCFIQNGDEWAEHQILSKRIGQDTECQRVINRQGGSSTPVYESVASTTCITQAEKNNLICPADYDGECWVPNGNNKWERYDIRSNPGDCQVIADGTARQPEGICKNDIFKDNNNFCRLEGIASNVEVYYPSRGITEDGSYQNSYTRVESRESTTEFSKVCGFASASFHDKTFVNSTDWYPETECDNKCHSLDKSGGIVQDGDVCVCVDEPPPSFYRKIPNKVIWNSRNQNISDQEIEGSSLNLESCKELCTSQDECLGFGMNKSQTKCWLKKNLANADYSELYDLYEKSVDEPPPSYHWKACPPNNQCGEDERGNELTCRNTSLSGAPESKRCLTQGDAEYACHEMERKGSHGYNTESDNCYKIPVYRKFPNKVIWASRNQNMGKIEGYSLNLESCKELCTSQNECLGFNMNKSQSSCWLKKNLANVDYSELYDHYEKSVDSTPPATTSPSPSTLPQPPTTLDCTDFIYPTRCPTRCYPATTRCSRIDNDINSLYPTRPDPTLLSSRTFYSSRDIDLRYLPEILTNTEANGRDNCLSTGATLETCRQRQETLDRVAREKFEDAERGRVAREGVAERARAERERWAALPDATKNAYVCNRGRMTAGSWYYTTAHGCVFENGAMTYTGTERLFN
jgi:hypothetical protein